jgi:hypothetical protein
MYNELLKNVILDRSTANGNLDIGHHQLMFSLLMLCQFSGCKHFHVCFPYSPFFVVLMTLLIMLYVSVTLHMLCVILSASLICSYS